MLTKECANCPFWIDTENAHGCGYVRPISECKAFAKAFEEWEKAHDSANDSKER